jgi:hypothetical protein
MILVTSNWRIWLAGTAASLAIFAVVYFTAIAPSTNAANQAIKQGLQQTQHAIKQAEKQLSDATGPAAAGQPAPQVSNGASQVSAAAQTTLSKTARLAQCVAAAGTDPTKLQACQSQYGG